MTQRSFPLRVLASLWVVAAFVSAVIAAGLWFTSTTRWEAFLDRAYVTGFATYESLRSGVAPPAGVSMRRLVTEEAWLAEQGRFERLRGMPRPAYVTRMSVHQSTQPALLPTAPHGDTLVLAVVSDQLVYPVSDLIAAPGQTAPDKLGQVTRLMASYCSRATIFARYGEGQWLAINGEDHWGCTAAPRDLRLPAILAAILALGAILSHVAATTQSFGTVANALRTRRRQGGPESYELTGPAELRDIVEAVNVHLEDERAQLSQRAVVLSGVSHDLGTPATRLRLRTALIEDDELRGKLQADIDQMIGIIDSVLTYTRAELNTEPPRQLALASLVEALVADYQDTGRPVSMEDAESAAIESANSLFSARRGRASGLQAQPVLVIARPVSLQRAISNLIDNALKYGRRAYVRLETTAETAQITIEDEGTSVSAEHIEALVAPFSRGSNTASIAGFGLGLTIASTVAAQHGGDLRFSRGSRGLQARLTISRR